MPNIEPPLDPKEALTDIKTLARVALQCDNLKAMQKQIEMILVLVNKALPRAKPR